MGSNPTVSGVISGKLILAAGFIQSTLWRGLASCFDLDRFLRVYMRFRGSGADLNTQLGALSKTT